VRGAAAARARARARAPAPNPTPRRLRRAAVRYGPHERFAAPLTEMMVCGWRAAVEADKLAASAKSAAAAQ
jgi:hypothetical protein